MNVELWEIGRLSPYGKNPRKISDKAVAKVATSIKSFGWKQPIVVDKEGVVIVGHTRLKAAQKLGLDRVPVLVAADLTPAQVRAYRIADNRTGEETAWDEDLLTEELELLSEDEEELLAALGFDERELRALLDTDEELERAEATPPVPVNPTTLPGDVWILGDHRIICGDSTDPAVVERLLAGASPHLMVTDPPYGVEYKPDWRDEALGRGDRETGTAKGRVLNDDQADWTKAWALFRGNVAYVWHGGLHAGTVAQSLTSQGFLLRAQIIWDKGRPILSRGHFHWRHEPAWYATRDERPQPKEPALRGVRLRPAGSREHYADHHRAAWYCVRGKGAWTGDRKQSTVWTIPHRRNDTGHGTQKPVECMRRPMLNNSMPGDAVYEPFSGSGTTIIAAEMTGRRCYAVELDPAYVDVAVMRWQQYTGLEARLETPGAPTYAQVSDERYDADENSKASYDEAIKHLRREHLIKVGKGDRPDPHAAPPKPTKARKSKKEAVQ